MFEELEDSLYTILEEEYYDEITNLGLDPEEVISNILDIVHEEVVELSDLLEEMADREIDNARF